MKISIYALINPITTHVFYIGATQTPKNRLTNHILNSKNGTSYKDYQIQEIINSGNTVEMEILEECEPEKAAFLECFYLDLFKSYGFYLPQSMTAFYPSDRLKYLPEFVNVRVKITKKMDDFLNIASENCEHNKHEIIFSAISDKIRKILYSNTEHSNSIRPELMRQFEIPLEIEEDI